jgi:hypothetical protein
MTTSILAKNTAAALLLAQGMSFPTAAMMNALPPPPPRLATRTPQQHVDCHFPFPSAHARHCPHAPITPPPPQQRNGTPTASDIFHRHGRPAAAPPTPQHARRPPLAPTTPPCGRRAATAPPTPRHARHCLS